MRIEPNGSVNGRSKKRGHCMTAQIVRKRDLVEPEVTLETPHLKRETVEERPSPGEAPATAPEKPADSEKPAEPEKPAAAAPKRSIKKWVLIGLGLAALVGGALYGYRWWTVGRFLVSTDDAYIQADVTPLIAKVSGYITAIPVKDNAPVAAGDVLAEIDPGDYELALRTAENKLQTQHATVDRIAAQTLADVAAQAQAEAQVTSAEARRVQAQADYERAVALTARQVSSRQTLDAARAARDTAVAEVASAQAAVAEAKANVEVAKAQQKEARATLGELETARASAERDLSFTKVRAPAAGVVGNRAVDVGSYVSTGSRVMAIVPMNTLYVAANFKETQLASIMPGQEAELTVDAVKHVTFKGRVESIAPASGSVFSLLPVENATGNFTKIVQRVPVRIAIPVEDVSQFGLRPGLSVVVDVDTRTTPAQTSGSAQ
jgi:membrane fusion protein (multidrug efflux system)